MYKNLIGYREGKNFSGRLNKEVILEWNLEVQQGEESWTQDFQAERTTCTNEGRQKQSWVITYCKKFSTAETWSEWRRERERGE